MKEEKLLEILGQVKDEYIEEASLMKKDVMNEYIEDISLMTEDEMEESKLLQRWKDKKSDKRRSSWVKWCAMAACFCLVVLGVFWGQNEQEIYAKEVSYISIDVNPSLELCLNKFDKVVDVTAYNEDGQRVADCLNVKNKYYQDAIKEILDNEVFCEYLGKDADLTFTIVSEREAEIRAGIEECTNDNDYKNGQTTIYCADSETHQRAHKNGCSVGKYAAYEELVQYDESVTIEDCESMSMHEIHNRINECKSHHGLENNWNEDDSSVDSSKNNTTGSSTIDNGEQGHHSGRHHK